MRRVSAIAVAIASLAAARPALSQHSSAAGEVVPAGTTLMVKLLTELSTKTNPATITSPCART